MGSPSRISNYVPVGVAQLIGMYSKPRGALTPLQPVILGITPNIGPAAGGTLIRIYGYNFDKVSSVTIGGAPCTGVIVGGGIITCFSPAGAGAVNVVVTGSAGSATLVGGFTYTGAAPLGRIVCVGDSLTYGHLSSDPGNTTSYPYHLAATLGLTFGTDVINWGVNSLQAFTVASDIDFLLESGKSNVMIIMLGFNDIYGSIARTGTQAYNDLAAYVTERQAAGWAVTVCTLTGNFFGTSGTRAEASTFRTLVRANFASVVDIAADPDIGTIPTATYYNADGVHLTDAGYTYLAGLISAKALPVTGGASVGVDESPTRDAHLTGWYRDKYRPATTDQQLDLWFNETDLLTSQVNKRLIDSGSPVPNRVLSAVNGHPALNFTGDPTCFWLGESPWTLSTFFSASTFLVHVVVNVTSIGSNDTVNPHSNDGIICDSGFVWGMHLQSGGPLVNAYVNDGGVQKVSASISLATWCVVSMRLKAGKLGIRVNTTGSWNEVTCGNISDVTNRIKIGQNGTGVHPFIGKIAEVIIRDNHDATRETADDAYFRARWGVT